MSNHPEDWAQQLTFFAAQIDPLVKAVLEADEPWDAYRAAADIANPILENESLSNAGELYVAWRELEDVYETGRTPVADAHMTLRQAAIDWLSRPSDADPQFFEEWRVRTINTVGERFRRDGDFWRDGKGS